MSQIIVDIAGTPHTIERSVDADFPIFAKNIGQKYLVLASGDGDLFNPLDSGHMMNQQDRKRGQPLWQLRPCSEECYRDYTSFLRSKNRTPYLLAQRRFQNDI